MNFERSLFPLLAVTSLLFGISSSAQSEEITSININSTEAAAVHVKDAVLAHTGMIFPTDHTGKVTSDNLADQFAQLQKNIEDILNSGDSEVDDLVRVNWYIADAKHLKEIQNLRGTVSYALTTVVTPLPVENALLGVDLVFVSGMNCETVTHLTSQNTRISLMPKGRAVYISGQLQKGDGVVGTTRNTMEGLHKTLKQIGLEASHVVSIKTFLDPMSKMSEVEEVIDSFYAPGETPAVTHVEWKSKDTIEIEMVAFAPEDLELKDEDRSETVQHFWLDWLTVSPVYCRYTLINTDSRIYISEILSEEKVGYEEEIHSLFAELKKRLELVDSDMNHLAKATYYVSDDGVSGPFGKLRHEYYDPKHPPAASKATVESLGNSERTILIDMIAAPVKK